MVVFGHRAGIAVAELQHDVVVDGELQRLAHLHVVIRLVGDVGARHDRCRRDDFVLDQVEPVEDRHVVGRGLEIGVDFAGLEGADHGRRIGAVVDEFDAVEIDVAVPPLVVFAALVHDLLADIVGDELERAGADRAGFEVAALLVEGLVHDQAGIVADVRDDRDVGGRQLQLHRHVVDLGHRTFAQRAGLVVEQRAEAAGHRIALGLLLGPAGEIEDHVVGGEGVAIVPGRALARMQHVFGGVVIHFPGFDEVGPERVFVGVLDQRLERLALGIGDFRPVGFARVLGILDPHGDLEDAALLGLVGGERRRRHGEAEHSVGHRGGSAEHAGQRQEFATVDLSCLGLFGRLDDVIGNPIAVTPVECHD